MRTLVLSATAIGVLALHAQEVPKESAMDMGAFGNRPSTSDPGRWRLDLGIGFNAAQKDAANAPLTWSDVFGGRPHRTPQEFMWPVIFLEAEYRTAGKLSLGIHYDSWKHERWVKGDLTYGNFWNTVTTYMASARWTWTSIGSKPEFYSGAMIGVANQHLDSRVSHDGNSDAFPHGDRSLTAYQFTAIGMRTGRLLGFSLELGYGFKGFVSTGLSFRFG